MKLLHEDFRVYAVTDHTWAADDVAFFQQIRDAAAGGVRVFQLREKNVGAERLLELAVRFTALCRELGVISIINDLPETALLCGADGVHVGQDDLDVIQARRILGPDKMIGVSAHSVEEALRAQENGADYLGVGAAFITATKSNAKPISKETISAITRAVHIPVVAIGGVNPKNVFQLKDCGLAGVAVVSAIFAQPDARQAAQTLAQLCTDIFPPIERR
ncbi:MAG: thiamine phosphate synthase [Oscillibacter sp.]|nr:thiamine phosphate synthase [Oscillibacter sp.]